MAIIWSICRRDLVAAFTTPLAWLVLAAAHGSRHEGKELGEALERARALGFRDSRILKVDDREVLQHLDYRWCNLLEADCPDFAHFDRMQHVSL